MSQDAAQVLTEYSGMMAYVVRGILSDPQEIEECLGEVGRKVVERLPDYNPEKGALSTWLTAICRNTAVDHLRSLERRRREDAPLPEAADGAPGPEESLLHKERAAALRRALETLKEGDRRLFYRKYYYLQSTARLAAELGTTERAVEGRLYRIRKKLQRELGGDWR